MAKRKTQPTRTAREALAAEVDALEMKITSAGIRPAEPLTSDEIRARLAAGERMCRQCGRLFTPTPTLDPCPHCGEPYRRPIGEPSTWPGPPES